MKIKRAIITGGTGLIGLSLIKYLSEKGINITVVVRPNSKNINMINSPNVNIVKCDLSKLLSLNSTLLGDFDVFFHLGWNTSSREIINDPYEQSLNIQNTIDAVYLAKRLNCKVFIGAGSQAEYGNINEILTPNSQTNPISCYGISKLAAGKLSQKLCENFNIRHNWCRILSVYGKEDKENTGIMYCINTLLDGNSPFLTKCEQMWDYMYSEDCARALYMISENGKHGIYYPIGSGESKQLCEYFEYIRDYINTKIQLGFDKKEYNSSQVMYLKTDISRLKCDTGFIPEYSFEKGISETIEHIKSRRRI